MKVLGDFSKKIGLKGLCPLNGMVWKKCPKDVFVGRETLEMGVSSAIIALMMDQKEFWMFCVNASLIQDILLNYLSYRDNQRIEVMDYKHQTVYGTGLF